jgi:phosphoglucomutase/phosphomannomutase
MDFLEQATAGLQTVQTEEALRQQALRYLSQWLTQRAFTDYQPQLAWLIESGQWAGLLDRFYQVLPFGTGGRRGAVGIGPNRMNRWTLGASVQGHCEYLKERFPDAQAIHVVLGYDVRRFLDRNRQYRAELPNPVLHLSSRDLAQHAAGVYVANGIHAHILPPDSTRFLATPELSFYIRHLHSQGGLNISASHNPPDDNGGKFYDERGGQPVPPEDQIMADLVDQVDEIRFLAWPDAVRSGRIHFLDDAPHRAYIDLCRRASLIPRPRLDEIRVVFTPLHGVGAMTAMEVLTDQGFSVIPVAEQMTPDGQFTNVTKSPNPEVPESMDRARETATRHRADLVLATDPDADRLGAMVPGTSTGDGPWRFLTGNQIAALLTHFKLSRLAESGLLPGSPIVVKTDVTTSLITRIARRFGAQVVDNLLVGFKYIGDVLWQLEQHGGYEDVRGTPDDFVIGCEESHGILVTQRIRDKDAAAAALLMAELTLDQKRRGRDVVKYLDHIHREFGYFQNLVRPVVMTGIAGKQKMARMLDRLRAEPPDAIGGLAVTRFEDLRDETGRLGTFKGLTDQAARNVLVFVLGETGRIALRPSGTEPKAKAYIEVCSVPQRAGLTDAQWVAECQRIDGLAQLITTDFMSLALGKSQE